MKITTVDQEAIDLGIAENCSECPVAIAMKRNNYTEPVVGSDKISYYNSNKPSDLDMIIKPISKRIAIRINRFDNGHTIRPFKIIEGDIFDIYEEKQ